MSDSSSVDSAIIGMAALNSLGGMFGWWNCPPASRAVGAGAAGCPPPCSLPNVIIYAKALEKLANPKKKQKLNTWEALHLVQMSRFCNPGARPVGCNDRF